MVAPWRWSDLHAPFVDRLSGARIGGGDSQHANERGGQNGFCF